MKSGVQGEIYTLITQTYVKYMQLKRSSGSWSHDYGLSYMSTLIIWGDTLEKTVSFCEIEMTDYGISKHHLIDYLRKDWICTFGIIIDIHIRSFSHMYARAYNYNVIFIISDFILMDWFEYVKYTLKPCNFLYVFNEICILIWEGVSGVGLNWWQMIEESNVK